MEKDQNPVDNHRRGFLLGAVSAASLLATGCGSPLPAKLHEQDGCTRVTSSYLGGKEVADAWKAPYRYIDAHAHFFNASDVPAHGFLAASVVHRYVHNPTLQKIAGIVAAAVEGLANTALDPLNEMRQLCEQTSGMGTQSIAVRTQALDADIEHEQMRNARKLSDQLRGTDVPALVDQVLGGLRDQAGGQHLRHQRFSEEFLFDSARGVPLLKPSAPAALAGMEDLDIQNMLRAGIYMLGPRHHSLRDYIRRQAAASPDALMSASVSAMVDFNYWLRGAGRATNIRDQVLIQEQLALMSGGFLLPVVAYNPWADIEDDGESSRTVRWAVEHHGCVGVKIYPPMGFYPFGNGNLRRPAQPGRAPDLHVLDKTLEKFYGLCEELDVPVMAHGNDSNGRNESENMLAGVAGWSELDRLPNIKRLYVNIGHFGGALNHPDPGGGKDVDWTAQYAQLMQSAGKLKVFGDIGYWHDLYGQKHGDDVRKKLRDVLPLPLPGGQTVADRVMYGSDWFMTAKERDWEAYPGRILSELRGIASEDVARRIMGGNVLECYGLAEGSTRRNRLRLEAYYQQPGRQAPGWMGRVRPLGELRALGA